MTDLDAESRRILELARQARTPSAEDKARVEQRFAVALGLSATAAAGTATTSAHAANAATTAKSAAGAAGLKWWIGGVLVAGAVASYVGFSTPALPSPHAAKAIAAASTPAAPVPLRPAPVSKSSADAEPAALSQQAGSVQAHAAQPSPAQHTAHRVEPRRPVAHGDTLAAELELLHRAQAAWRAREAQSALALLNEHRTRYPHSQLELERDALQVLTLCELGQKEEASRVARSVLSRAPRSPLRASLEQSCAFK